MGAERPTADGKPQGREWEEAPSKEPPAPPDAQSWGMTLADGAAFEHQPGAQHELEHLPTRLPAGWETPVQPSNHPASPGLGPSPAAHTRTQMSARGRPRSVADGAQNWKQPACPSGGDCWRNYSARKNIKPPGRTRRQGKISFEKKKSQGTEHDEWRVCCVLKMRPHLQEETHAQRVAHTWRILLIK